MCGESSVYASSSPPSLSSALCCFLTTFLLHLAYKGVPFGPVVFLRLYLLTCIFTLSLLKPLNSPMCPCIGVNWPRGTATSSQECWWRLGLACHGTMALIGAGLPFRASCALLVPAPAVLLTLLSSPPEPRPSSNSSSETHSLRRSQHWAQAPSDSCGPWPSPTDGQCSLSQHLVCSCQKSLLPLRSVFSWYHFFWPCTSCQFLAHLMKGFRAKNLNQWGLFSFEHQ